MTRPRTIVIDTIDYGSVEIECPSWCIGHGWQLDPYRNDITHRSVRVKSGANTEALGEVPMLRTNVTWAPFQELFPLVYVHLDFIHDLPAEDIAKVAQGLRVAAMRLEKVAAEAQRLRNGGQV